METFFADTPEDWTRFPYTELTVKMVEFGLVIEFGHRPEKF